MVQTDLRLAAEGLRPAYESVRSLTEELSRPLSAEDQTVQSMPDVSPTKWHRAHTSWFFETFVLRPSDPGYRTFDDHYEFLFNSYYEAVGPRPPRPERGLLSRPGIAEISSYRHHVDDAMFGLLDRCRDPKAMTLAELGCHHEQQHQELIVMDIKHVLSRNPLHPPYHNLRPPETPANRAPASATWVSHDGGLVEIGHDGEGFAFDNEGPRHLEFLQPFQLSESLVTNREWLAFMSDGGYERPELWLSEGWLVIQECGWSAPLYWERDCGVWRQYTLGGLQAVEPDEPVCHISLFEADAFARWAGARLPTEAEWEAVASRRAGESLEGNFLQPGVLHPRPVAEQPSFFGDVWQWTSSSYSGYPGFRPSAGAVGEYNGKFMANQYVLRGGSCATPAGHTRPTYRNFFPAGARWAFSGVRLARDA